MSYLRTLALAAFIASLAPLVCRASFPADAMNWKIRLNVSAYSDRIYLIQVEKVIWSEKTAKNGLEIHPFTIRGKVLEELRGEAPENPFIHRDVLTKITDYEAYRAAGGIENEVIEISLSRMTGAADCKAGHRYVVIHVRGLASFVPIEDGDAWRALIRPRVREDKQALRQERAKPNKSENER